MTAGWLMTLVQSHPVAMRGMVVASRIPRKSINSFVSPISFRQPLPASVGYQPSPFTLVTSMGTLSHPPQSSVSRS